MSMDPRPDLPPDVPASPNEGSEPPVFARAVPPTSRVLVPPPVALSKWPTVIGVVAIVYSGLMLVCGGGGAVMSRFALSHQQIQAQLFETGSLYKMSYAVWMLSWAASILLLIAGIGLTMRRRWSVSVARIWAVAAAIMALLGAVLGYANADTVMNQMAQSSRTAMPAGAMSAFALIGVLISLLFHLALPVFLLIWFAREKIKAEAAGWR